MAVGVHRLPLGELLRRERRPVVVFLDRSGAMCQCVFGLGAQQLTGSRLRWQALGNQGQGSQEQRSLVSSTRGGLFSTPLFGLAGLSNESLQRTGTAAVSLAYGCRAQLRPALCGGLTGR